MPRTIACSNCGIRLNLPDQSAGRRLKCPKCGFKFQATAQDLSAASTAPGVSDARLDSLSGLMPVPRDLPDSGLAPVPPGLGEIPLPTAEGGLRETFELPLMTEGEKVTVSHSSREAADALALFRDKPNAPRRLSAAEARAQNRRCPTCGSVVLAGTSICSTCNLDLESGQRIGFDDEDFFSEAPVAAPSMPLDIAIVGGICLLASTILSIVSFVLWMRGLDGAQFLSLVCLFGVYGSVWFLRLKSVKPLLVALTLGALINIVGLIWLPAYKAYTEREAEQQAITDENPDAAEIAIPSVAERLDTQKISWGIALLCLYAAICLYLLSTGVRTRFSTPRATSIPLA